VNLHFSDTSKATVPGTVSFAPGTTSVTVPLTGVAPGTATITASATGIASATASVTVTPPPKVTASYAANFLQVIDVVLTNIGGVTAVNLRIISVTNVTAAAPNVIALRPNVIIPMPYGNLAAGQAVARNFTFIATAGSVEVPFSFIVTYEADNMPPQTAVIDVPFPRSMSFSGSPLAINAGASGQLTLSLLGNQAPVAGLIVNLNSSDPSRATVPATVSFAPGATSITVPVTGIAPGSAVITATATVVNFPAIATAAVNVSGTIKSPANTPVRLGQSALFAVTLPAPAPSGGVTVTLKSGDTSKVTVTPASVVIPQGATTPTTQPQVTGAGIGSATITAAATGYISGAGAVTVTAPTMSFTGSPLVIALGESVKLTLILNGGQAPAGGLTVNLSSSDTSKATVPATVSFAPGATSVSLPVAGVAPGAATITANAPNIASATASVTVTGTINTPTNTPVNLGQSTSFAVRLSAPAPAGGVTVTLKSSDTSKVIVTPASVVIPQGATTPATQPQVTGAGIGGATITAVATGYTSGTGTVTVTAPTMVFTGSPLIIAIGGSGKLTLTLSGGQAPTGGLTVNLNSSDTSKATVPGTVTFAAGATSVPVPVAAVSPGAVTITASAPNVASATGSVTVTPPPTVTATYAVNFLAVIDVHFVNTSGVTAVNLRLLSVTNVTAPAPNVIALRPNAVFPQPLVGALAGGQGLAWGFLFEATAGSLSVPFSFTITYEADNMPVRTAVIDVPFPRAMNLSGSPLAINVGASGNLTLNLTGHQAPTGGLPVNLTSSDPSRATVPASVTVPAGATRVTVPVTGIAPGSVTISGNATVRNLPATATATVNVTGTIISPANTPVKLGQSAPFAVTLPAPAPAGGVTVTLKSSDPSKVTVTPASVIIPQGATTPAIQPQVTGVDIGAATITAMATGYISGAGAVTVTAPTMAFAFAAPLPAIVVGGVGILTLSLIGAPAPPGGLMVNLSSSDTSKANVRGRVSFAAGATTVTVQVAGVATGTVTITASAPGIASATANMTVTPSPTVNAAYGANFIQLINVILTNTSGVTAVNLRITGVTNIRADAPNVIALRPNVIIPMPYGNLAGGQTTVRSFSFEATAGKVEVPFSFTITYEADNMTPQTAVINVPFPRSMSFSGSPLAINPGVAGRLTLNLLGNQAPAAGLIVNLSSSDPSRATVPATVSFPPGATSVTVPVEGLLPGSVTITATATVVNFAAIATAVVNVGGGR
jgi:hypothetical protein